MNDDAGNGSLLLQELEYHFNRVFQSMSDIIVVTDSAGIITFESPSTSTVLGHPPGHFIGRSPFSLIHEDDVEMVLQEFAEVVQRKNTGVPTEFRARRADGSWIYLEAVGNNLAASPGIQGMVITARDVTGRRRMEDRLRESEARWQFALEGAGDGLWDWDIQAGTVFFSRQWKAILGFGEDEIEGSIEEWETRVHPEDIVRTHEELERHFRGETPVYTCEHRLRCKDGSYKWILDRGQVMKWAPDGKPLRMIGTHSDISARKQAEEALRESETRFRAVFETAMDSIFIKDRSLRYTLVNPAMERLFGRSAAELIGHSDDDLFGPEAGAHLRETDGAVLRGVILDEEHSKPVDGTMRTFHTIKVPLRDDKGEVAGLCGFARDVSERKRTEEALRESESKFRDLSEKAIVGIYLIQDDVFEYVNAEFAHVFGYRLEEMQGRMKVRDLILPEDLPVVEEAIQRRIAGEQKSIRYDFRVLTKGGDIKHVEVYSSRTMYRGRPAVIGTLLDITERKRAEAALKDSEEAFRTIFEESPFIVALNDRESGVYVNVNRYFCRFSGMTKDEVIGKTPRDFNFLLDSLAEYAVMERLIKDGRVDLEELRLRNFRDEHFTMLLSARVVSIAGRPHILSVLQDITERKRVEEELRDSEEKFRVLFESANDAILIWSRDRFVDCNQKVLDLFGYASKEEILGRPFTRFSPRYQPDGRSSVKSAFDRLKAAMAGEPQFFAWQLHRSDDTLIDAEVTLHAVEMKGKTLIQTIVRDVTERKRAEENLKRLSVALEQAAEEIIITDPEGIIEYVNPAFERITGYSRTEAVGRSPRILKSGMHDPVFYTHLWNTIKNGDIWTGRITNRRKDGVLIQEEATISPILNSADQITGFISLKRDITEEIKLETRLRQAQKMEAIGTLAGGIAHDFNNILGAMMGYTELARLKTSDTQIRPYLDQVLNACNRSKDLVNQILTFSRQREQERKPVTVTPIVKEAMKLLRSSFPSTIEIRQSYAAGGDIILADPTQIHQVIVNLCTNAIHAMRERGGILDVRLDRQDIAPGRPGYDAELKAGPYLMLTIGDTGQGMEASVRNRIFDPFFTTKAPGEGTGLGLSVVYGIVKNHGGAISVESEAGKGTVFTIHFPLIEAGGEDEEQKVEPFPAGRGSILLVDDEEPLASLGREMLVSLGYDVTVRVSSPDALEAFRANPDRFDLVITDMTMPNMTGDLLALEILKIRPGLPVILTTGFSEKISEEEAKRIGIRVFVLKPISIKALARAVQEALQ